MATETEQILERLDYIKDHLIDADIVLTDEDIASLKEAEFDLEKGETEKL